jgi:hypothetical protein
MPALINPFWIPMSNLDLDNGEYALLKVDRKGEYPFQVC